MTNELVTPQEFTAWGCNKKLTQHAAAYQMLQALYHAGLLSEEQGRLVSEQPFHFTDSQPSLVRLDGNGALAAAGKLDIDREFVAKIKVKFEVVCTAN